MTSPSEASSPVARAVALGALGGVLDKRQTLDRAIAGTPEFARLSPRDRAFARLLVATVLRHWGELDALIETALERPLARSARFAPIGVRRGFFAPGSPMVPGSAENSVDKPRQENNA